MNFFELPERPPPAPTEPPAWLAPPEHELGVVLAVERTLARTDDAVVSLRSLTVHTTGLAVEAVAARRPGPRAPGDEVLLGHWHPALGGPPPPEFVRFGVQLGDGAKATNLDPFPAHEQQPEPPVLVVAGGGGGPDRQVLSFWIWPLPQRGMLELVCEWPAASIPVARLELDADRIVAAAARVEPLWPE